jgi:hypothetical protein
MLRQKAEFLLHSVLHLITILVSRITWKVTTSISVINNSLIKNIYNDKLKFQVTSFKSANKHDSTL